MAFKGKPPGSGSGEMSRKTKALRPQIGLSQKGIEQARKLRRAGHEPAQIAEALAAPVEEVEKALVQMRMPRPETTRGTLNITLAAHRFVMAERKGDEPMWMTFDRLVDELLRRRAADQPRRRKAGEEESLPLFPPGEAPTPPAAAAPSAAPPPPAR